MDVFVRGKGKVSLGQGDFVAQGGQGSVYAKGNMAYKIYADPAGMIPVAKIQELSVLALPTIIRPQDVLLDRSNVPVGYTMARVKDAHALCQVFTRAFRDRHNLTPDRMLALVRKLQEGVQHVHDRNMLIVDLNEMNFLVTENVGSNDANVLFIDVDSYQTPGFKATALMDSVRDRHNPGNQFSEDTDWFSFGVVSFQMFIGIHPYKGKHPTLADMDARMWQNVSVLNKDVSVPKVCYPFDVIPQAYLHWYRAVFEQGKRCAPPFDLNAPIVLTPVVQRITGSAQLAIQMLGVFPAPLVLPLPNAGPLCGVTTQGLIMRGKQILADSNARIVLTPRMNTLLAASLRGGKVRFYDVTHDRALPAEFDADAIMTYQDRLYIKNGMGLYEVEFVEFGSGPQLALKTVGNALPNATQLFEGVVTQNLLGAQYVSVFPRPGTCHSVRVRELDGHRIVDARFDNNVLMLIGARNGAYHKFILRFDAAYTAYDVRVVPDVVFEGLNFVTLDNGVCVHVNEKEELELFSNCKGATGVKIITDAAIQGAQLFKNGTQVLFSKGDTLYSMSMKPY
jgi:hypothetical protein